MTRSFVTLLLCCFISLVGALSQERGQVPRTRSGLTGKRIALVIGNGKYAEASLQNPPNDARGVAAALRELQFDVAELTDQTKPQMRQALRAFGDKLESGEGNVALFYFAGHGVQVNGRNFLIPIEADVTNEAEAEDACLNVDQVLAQMKRSRQGLNIVILDACRNNPFRGWRTPEGGLAFVNAPRGTLIAYATSPGRTAADGKGKNSPYTAALLSQIRRPNQNLLKMFENVRVEVESTTLGNQTPWESTSVTNGSEFYLAGRKEDPPPFDPRALELEYWNSIKTSRNPADFRAYLAKYPNGEFKSLAENRIADLSPATGSPGPSTRLPALRTVSFTTGEVRNGTVEKRQAECEIFVEDLGDNVSIEMVRIRGGSFQMGSPANEEGRSEDEGPQHYVSVSDFLFGRYEVTQAQWRAVAKMPKVKIDLNTDPSYFKGDNLPVESISWDEAREFIARLNKKLGLTEKTGYRLPSEAEWEYAARAGTTTRYGFGDEFNSSLINVAGKTIVGGSLGVANQWGLFEMHGNVWEWCEDDWHRNYQGAPTDGRAWIDSPSRGSYRVLRGGGWGGSAVNCRSALRGNGAPGSRNDDLGFRLLRTYR